MVLASVRFLAPFIMRIESDQRILCVVLANRNCQGMCFAMWLDPAKVPDVAADVMADAGHTFPLLLANRIRALCCDRMGRRFDIIMKRMPQVTPVFYISHLLCCCVIPTAGLYYFSRVLLGWINQRFAFK